MEEKHKMNDEDKEKKFHDLYWLGQKPLTKKAIIEAFKELDIQLSDSDWAMLYANTKQMREKTKSLRQRWLAKFPQNEDNQISFGEFLEKLDVLTKECCYCGISEEQLTLMNEQGLVKTKRSRGSSLEIERMEPDEAYSNFGNLRYACYWCNNAKTDTFTYDEFKEHIAPGIRKIWNSRLNIGGLELINTPEK